MLISRKSVTFVHYPMQIRDNLSKNGSNLDTKSLSKCGRECNHSTEKLSEQEFLHFLKKTNVEKRCFDNFTCISDGYGIRI